MRTLIATFVLAGSAVAQSTQRASVDSAGLQGNGTSGSGGCSADGRWVVFSSNAGNLVPSDTNAAVDIFLHDLVGGSTTRVSVDSAGQQSNGYSSSPSLSADGRYVAFDSQASNLVSGDTNGVGDVF